MSDFYTDDQTALLQLDKLLNKGKCDDDGEFVKKHRKNSKRIPKFNSFSDQRWKLDGTRLKNKADIWKSNDDWVFKSRLGYLIYVENYSKKWVLGAKSDGRVIHEVFEAGKDGQLWKKGATDAEGYFTLVNHGFKSKVLTAISESGLKIKGNITLRLTLLVDYLLTIYHVVVLHIDHDETQVEISVTFRFTQQFLTRLGTYPKYSLTILAARTVNVSKKEGIGF